MLTRLWKAGYVMRKEDQEINKNIFIATSLGCRMSGRPILRCADEVDEDAIMLGIRNWHEI